MATISNARLQKSLKSVEGKLRSFALSSDPSDLRTSRKITRLQRIARTAQIQRDRFSDFEVAF